MQLRSIFNHFYRLFPVAFGFLSCSFSRHCFFASFGFYRDFPLKFPVFFVDFFFSIFLSIDSIEHFLCSLSFSYDSVLFCISKLCHTAAISFWLFQCILLAGAEFIQRLFLDRLFPKIEIIAYSIVVSVFNVVTVHCSEFLQTPSQVLCLLLSQTRKKSHPLLMYEETPK